MEGKYINIAVVHLFLWEAMAQNGRLLLLWTDTELNIMYGFFSLSNKLNMWGKKRLISLALVVMWDPQIDQCVMRVSAWFVVWYDMI